MTITINDLLKDGISLQVACRELGIGGTRLQGWIKQACDALHDIPNGDREQWWNEKHERLTADLEAMRALDKANAAKRDCLHENIQARDAEISRLRDELNIRRSKDSKDYWVWQDNGNDLDSITCPILITAAQMRQLNGRLLNIDNARLKRELAATEDRLHAAQGQKATDLEVCGALRSQLTALGDTNAALHKSLLNAQGDIRARDEQLKRAAHSMKELTECVETLREEFEQLAAERDELRTTNTYHEGQLVAADQQCQQLREELDKEKSVPCPVCGQFPGVEAVVDAHIAAAKTSTGNVSSSPIEVPAQPKMRISTQRALAILHHATMRAAYADKDEFICAADVLVKLDSHAADLRRFLEMSIRDNLQLRGRLAATEEVAGHEKERLGRLAATEEVAGHEKERLGRLAATEEVAGHEKERLGRLAATEEVAGHEKERLGRLAATEEVAGHEKERLDRLADYLRFDPETVKRIITDAPDGKMVAMTDVIQPPLDIKVPKRPKYPTESVQKAVQDIRQIAQNFRPPLVAERTRLMNAAETVDLLTEYCDDLAGFANSRTASCEYLQGRLNDAEGIIEKVRAELQLSFDAPNENRIIGPVMRCRAIIDDYRNAPIDIEACMQHGAPSLSAEDIARMTPPPSPITDAIHTRSIAIKDHIDDLRCWVRDYIEANKSDVNMKHHLMQWRYVLTQLENLPAGDAKAANFEADTIRYQHSQFSAVMDNIVALQQWIHEWMAANDSPHQRPSMTAAVALRHVLEQLETVTSRREPKAMTDHEGQMAGLVTDLERWKGVAADEKKRRVYYQDIVYSVCHNIDRITGNVGHGIVCGTIDEPSIAVQRFMERLVCDISHVHNRLSQIITAARHTSSINLDEYTGLIIKFAEIAIAQLSGKPATHPPFQKGEGG